ncbi:MAG TPA: cytochrome c-type biogenesis protein CcmH, partial [Solirubrobacteraceae bacterium]|nr:cytochrome c-type biogenesis protein CcmH [Solirubrobacteraceae bacterium]
RRAAAVAALALALALPAAAGAAAPRASYPDVVAALMCDACNVPLAVAESPRADEERAEVRKLIGQGLTKKQILDHMEREWGPNILAEPHGGGASVTVWLVPAIVLVVLVAGVLALLPRWRRRRAAGDGATDEPPPLAAEDAARLEADLALYE